MAKKIRFSTIKSLYLGKIEDAVSMKVQYRLWSHDQRRDRNAIIIIIIINRKSQSIGFRLAPISMTLNDLERP